MLHLDLAAFPTWHCFAGTEDTRMKESQSGHWSQAVCSWVRSDSLWGGILRGHGMKPRRWSLTYNKDPRILEMLVMECFPRRTAGVKWSWPKRESMRTVGTRTRGLQLPKGVAAHMMPLRASEAGHGSTRFGVCPAVIQLYLGWVLLSFFSIFLFGNENVFFMVLYTRSIWLVGLTFIGTHR